MSFSRMERARGEEHPGGVGFERGRFHWMSRGVFFFPSSLYLSSAVSALKISGIFIITDLGQLVSRLTAQLSFDSRIINPFRARSIVVSDTFSVGTFTSIDIWLICNA